MPTGLAQDLETLRKDRIAVLGEALPLLTDNYLNGLIGVDSIVRLRTELLHARLELELPREQRLIFLKEAAQKARKFAELARGRYDAELAPLAHALLAKAGRLEIESLLLEMKDSPAGLAQDLETLRNKRIEMLEQFVAELTDQYSNGLGVEIEPIMQARIDLLKARLALSLPRAEKITLVEKAIQQIRTLEKLAQDCVARGQARQSAALVAEEGRLGMEILLFKMKGESSKLAQNAEILRKDRVAVLEKLVAMLTDDYAYGLLGFEQVTLRQIGLVEAQSELDLPRVQKVALLEEALKQARQNESLVQELREAGLRPLYEQILAKAGRLKIEIRLLEMKAIGDDPPKKSP